MVEVRAAFSPPEPTRTYSSAPAQPVIRSLRNEEMFHIFDRVLKQALMQEIRYIEMQRITAAQMLRNERLSNVVQVTTVALRMCFEIGSVPTLWQSGLIHRVLLMHTLMRWAEDAHSGQERRLRSHIACDPVERVVQYIAEGLAEPAAADVDHAEAIIGSQVPAWRMSVVMSAVPRRP